MNAALSPKPLKSNEWYTPARYIEAARDVMGSIDLDPASSVLANETVRAAQYLTIDDDGLSHPWIAQSVWLNPPYGRSARMQGLRQSTIKLFVDKLIRHYQAGDVGQAIVLATTEVNAAWFQPLWHYPLCFPDHRVHFVVPDARLKKYSQMFGTCFAYLGPNVDSFVSTFCRFGTVVQRLSPS